MDDAAAGRRHESYLTTSLFCDDTFFIEVFYYCEKNMNAKKELHCIYYYCHKCEEESPTIFYYLKLQRRHKRSPNVMVNR